MADMSQLPERPIFLIGYPRSGTTLLRFILSSHPRIYIPEETGFIPFLTREIDTPLTQDQVGRLLVKIGRLNRFWDGMVTELPTFFHSLPEPKLAFILDALYRIKIAPYDASRWGDKTPGYMDHIPLLSAVFTNAQFVHLIRDGRDAAVSARAKWQASRPYMDITYLINNWVRAMDYSRKDGAMLGGDRYLEIHYENLVISPADVTRQICDFLEEEFHPDMLEHSRLAEVDGARGQPGVLKPIFSNSVARWRELMSPFEQKLADQVAGTTLLTLGYELSGLDSFTSIERFKAWALSIKYHLTDYLRNTLYRLGLLTLNRGMRRRA